jgi:hypothetical protein
MGPLMPKQASLNGLVGGQCVVMARGAGTCRPSRGVRGAQQLNQTRAVTPVYLSPICGDTMLVAFVAWDKTCVEVQC